MTPKNKKKYEPLFFLFIKKNRQNNNDSFLLYRLVHLLVGVVSRAGEEAGGGERWRPPFQPSHGLQRLRHSPRQTHGNLPKKVGDF